MYEDALNRKIVGLIESVGPQTSVELTSKLKSTADKVKRTCGYLKSDNKLEKKGKSWAIPRSSDNYKLVDGLWV